MNEELLISLVKNREFLYNPEDSKYYDELRRNSAWEEIGEILKENENNCKAKWKKLRENFRKAYNLRKKIESSGQGKAFKPIRFYKEMSFILPFMNSWTHQSESPGRVKRIKTEDEQSCEETDPFVEVETILEIPSVKAHRKRKTLKVQKKGKLYTPKIKTLSVSSIESPNKYSPDNRKAEDDTVLMFFKNLGQTVAEFPPDLRVRVKRDVFNIVSEAEELFKRNYVSYGSACKEKWKKIRDNFRKACNLRQKQIESSGQDKPIKPIRYQKELSFILPFLKNESESTRSEPNKKMKVEDEQSWEDKDPLVEVQLREMPDSKVTKKRKTMETLTNLTITPVSTSSLENITPENRKEEEDPLVMFFKSIALTVAEFPPDLRVRVKRDVFNIVADAEEEVVQRHNFIH